MSQQDRNQLWKWLALIVIVICLAVFVVRVSPPASPRVAPTKDSEPLIIGFIIFAFGAGVLRLRPRFAALHPSYQYILDFLLFILYLGALPLVVWMLFNNPRWPKVFVDLLLWISIIIPSVLFGGQYIILSSLYREKRYGLYHRIVDKLQRLLPRNANLYITRATAYFEQGEYEKAVQAASGALERIPPIKKTEKQGKGSFKDWRVITAHNVRMQSFFALAQHELALEDADALIHIYPSDSVHYFNHSLAARAAEDFELAEADLEHISQMKLEPFHQAFLALSRGDLATRQGQTEEARAFYDEALAVPLAIPQQQQFIHGEAYGELSLIELRENNDEGAFKMGQTLEAANPNAVSTGLAFIYARRGEWDKAVNQWRRLIIVAPRFGQKDIMRRQYRRDPEFVALIEQILARLNIPPESSIDAGPSHPLSAS